jgi:hypothetical protein
MPVNRPVEVLTGAVTATREQLLAVARQSERTLLLGTVLLVSAVSAVTGYVLAQCYHVDVLTFFINSAEDCWFDWHTKMGIGRHCFSDYYVVVYAGMRPNPWEPFRLVGPWQNPMPGGNPYPAAGMLPHLLFGLPAELLHTPRLGLLGYLLALTIAVLTPAVWAARGARGWERVVVFVALGAAAIPAWAVIDRGNSVGFVAPIGLVFLVALRRQRWGLVAIMVVVAALVKPQFALLAVALFAARQWRWGGIALSGMVIAHLAAYLLWPRDFPKTIVQTIDTSLRYESAYESGFPIGWMFNVSFAKILADITAPNSHGFLNGFAPLFGYVVLVLVVVSVLALGRRIPPVMVGIALLAAVSLFHPVTYHYYLVFALSVAALVARDPDGPPGSGIFDRLATLGDRRRAVGVCVSLAAALSIAHIAAPALPIPVPTPGQTGTAPINDTAASWAPQLWLIACAVIIVSYARRPAIGTPADASTTSAPAEPTPALVQTSEDPRV